ncbi:MAG: hypothetical protein PHQ34_07670 [Methanothrix sp.]|nr:hypothetical protein [Methanothrix sp.]
MNEQLGLVMGQIDDRQVAEIEEIEELLEKLGSNTLKPFSQRMIEGLGMNIPDEVSSLPSVLDPTGCLSALLSGINAYNQKKQYENIRYALAYLIYKSRRYDQLISPKTDDDHEVTIMFFSRCKEAYQRDKIRIFYNIWANAIINADRDIEEKAFVFDLIASMRKEEIMALKIASNKFSLESARNVDLDEIAKTLNIDKGRAQQICIALQGKGLLHAVNSWGDIAGSSTPKQFAANDYVETLVRYIMDPTLKVRFQE